MTATLLAGRPFRGPKPKSVQVEFLGVNRLLGQQLSRRLPWRLPMHNLPTSHFVASVNQESRDSTWPPPPLSAVVRAPLPTHTSLTSMFASAKARWPLVSRAFFSGVPQVVPALPRQGGAPRAAGTLRL